MGDTGSLLIGLTTSILAISFIQENLVYKNDLTIASAPSVAIGVLIIPLFDTLRVFTLRIIKGRSPFSPDKTHIHHLLLELGMPHLMATSVLGIVNIVFIAFSFKFQWVGTLELGLLLLILATLLTGIVRLGLKLKNNKLKNA